MGCEPQLHDDEGLLRFTLLLQDQRHEFEGDKEGLVALDVIVCTKFYELPLRVPFQYNPVPLDCAYPYRTGEGKHICGNLYWLSPA